MSPELLGMDAADDFVALKQRREGKYDAKACDVWALGVLLYLLVTGKYAFEDPKRPDNVIATLQNIRKGKMRALPSRISPECGDLIRQMLQHEPTKRITLADMASHPWFRICNVDNLDALDELQASKPGASSQSPGNVDEVAPTQSFSFPHIAQSKQTPTTIEVDARVESGQTVQKSDRTGATTPPGQPMTSRNKSGDTVVRVTKVATADDDGIVEKQKGWFCKLLFCSQEKA
jgi:serine/threonine protein kinase